MKPIPGDLLRCTYTTAMYDLCGKMIGNFIGYVWGGETCLMIATTDVTAVHQVLILVMTEKSLVGYVEENSVRRIT